MKAAIYARYSTDLQDPRSISDQFAYCREYAARENIEVVRTFADEARSGGSMIDRDGLLDLMQAARTKQFDVVIVEALDRLSRDMEDLAGLHKRLKFAGIDILAVNDGAGPVDEIVVGFKAVIGHMFRVDNAKKVRRGMFGVVRDGRSAGGRAYGYRAVPGQVGHLEIVEAEAEVIRRIFNEYVDGLSPRRIAGSLNRDGVPPPRGKAWNASTINGSAQRGNGILNNELYVGKIVWNKVRMVKDPDTGRRVSRINAEQDWHRTDAPHLRIVSDELYSRVRTLRLSATRKKPEMQRRPKRILSGLLRCGVCGSGMTTSGKDKSRRVRIRCSAARESGTCPDPKTCYLDTVEDLVIQTLLRELRDPREVTEFIAQYVEARKRLVANSERRRGSLSRKIAEKTREIDRMVDGYAKGLLTDADLGGRFQTLKAERQQLEQELAEVPQEVNVVALHDKALSQYGIKLAQLREELQAGVDDGNSAGAKGLRELVDSVTVRPNRNGGISISIQGKLNALVGAEGFGRLGVVNGGSGGGI
jgi:DNA invertase Pin-like site-specific DNA recombinase